MLGVFICLVSPALLIYPDTSSPRESHLSFSVEVWVCMNQPRGHLESLQEAANLMGTEAFHQHSAHMRQEGTGRTGKGFKRAVKVSRPRKTLLTFSKGHTTLLPTTISKHHHKKLLTQETPLGRTTRPTWLSHHKQQ